MDDGQRKKNGSQPHVRALDRGLDILDCVLHAGRPLPLKEIAARVGLSPSTTLRILGTLETRRYLHRDRDSKLYETGPMIRRLFAVIPQDEAGGLADIALPHMEELNRQFGESISVFVPDGDHRICIQRVESSHPLRQVVNIGDRLKLAVGSGGKVLAAWLAVAPHHTMSQGVQAQLSDEQLQRIRDAGYAVSFNERVDGVYAVSAPVFDRSDSVVACLSLSGPTVRFSPEHLPEIADAMMKAARCISTDLGWRGGRG